jgi:predicted PurR-regulated permease PerM
VARTTADGARLGTIVQAIAVIGIALLLWFTVKLVLVLFASVLLAIFLRGCADWLASVSGVSPRAALAVVGGFFLIAIASTAALLAPEVSAQLDVMGERIPQAWNDVVSRITHYSWGRRLLTTPPAASDSVAIVSNAGLVVAMTLGTVAHFVVFVLVGVYLAIDPDPYVAALLWFAPAGRRDDTRRILARIGRLLRAWLMSRTIAMSIVAVFTTLGLWALGLQPALTLGLAAGVMTFVPYVGAFLSGAPALLLAFVQSQALAGWVVLLYTLVHVIEGYFVTPLVEQEAIRLPPAASIAAQVILGSALGVLGLILASPITASAIVVAQSLAASKEPAKAA